MTARLLLVFFGTMAVAASVTIALHAVEFGRYGTALFFLGWAGVIGYLTNRAIWLKNDPE